MSSSQRWVLAAAIWALASCAPARDARPARPPGLPNEGPADPLRLPLGSPSAPAGEVTLRPGAVFDTRAGEAIPWAELPRRISSARVVFVGERHDHLAHRQAAARLLDSLAQVPGPLLVGLEMLERRAGVQTVLDAYSRGELDERRFAAQVSWYSQWGYDFRLYRPIFEKAKIRRLPLVALNVERAVVRKVGRGGLEALSEKERAGLPLLRLEVPNHRALFDALLGRGPGPGLGRGAPRGGDRAEPGGSPVGASGGRAHPGTPAHLFAAQVLRDEVMAQGIARRLEVAGPKARMLVIAGGGHLYFGTGTNARLRLSQPDLAQATVLFLPAPAEGRRVSRAAGDFLVGTSSPALAERALSLGIVLAERSDGKPGVLVERLRPGPVQAAGIRAGDFIVALDGDATSNVFAFRWAMEQRSWGERPVFTVERGEERLDLVVHLKPERGPRPGPRRPSTALVPIGP